MTTALELGRAGWKSYIQKRRHVPASLEGTADEQVERMRLLARVGTAAVLLKNRFGVRRVVLFGSLADETWFRADSDVDLAVEGLSVNDYWEAWRLVEEVIGDRLVDFVEIEMVGTTLRQMIERYGVEL
jgi:predicted nucleotidyltransferase